jgi:DNA-directed RNA polymerase subunit L
MEIKIVNEEKGILDVEISNLTMAEVLRVYANKQGAKLAAWRKEHQTSNPILHIESDNPKKLLKDAIKALEKEIDQTVDELKKLK